MKQLLHQLEELNQKDRQGIAWNETDKEVVCKICECDSYLYKSRLIEMLEKHRQDDSYDILKKLLKDKDEVIRYEAVSVIMGAFLRYEDFWNLYEELCQDTPLVVSEVVKGTGYIADIRNIKREVAIQRLQDIQRKYEKRSNDYVQVMIENQLYFFTEDKKYLDKIAAHMYDDSCDTRYQVLAVLEEIAEYSSDNMEIRQFILERLFQKILSGDRYRYLRIYAIQIYRNICMDMQGTDDSNIMDEKERNFYFNLCERLEYHPTADDILSFCIFKIYYPVEESKEQIFNLLDQYVEKLDDIRLFIFGAYLHIYEARKGENRYFMRLTKQKESAANENKALLLYLKALAVIYENADDYINEQALLYLRESLKYFEGFPVVYDRIAQFSSIESKEHDWAKTKSKNFKKKITEEEIESISLKELYSYQMYFDMEITRKIEKPENFLIS